MFGNTSRQNIRLKFLSIIAGILVISTITVSIIIAISIRQMLRQSLTSTGQGIASYIAKLSLDPLIIKDYLQLDSFVNDANKDEDIIYIIIQDAQGNIITSQYSSINYRSPRFTALLSRLSKDSELRDIIAAVKREEAVTELSAPILTGSDTIGKVTVCMSQQKIYREMIKTILFVIALNIGFAFMLGYVLFVVSQKTIIAPISELAHATGRLAQGDLATRVHIKAEGEIQMLVDSFNRMAANLDTTTVSRNYLDEIISSMSDTLIVVSPDRTITRVNTATSSLLRYQEKELEGRPMDVVLPDAAGMENSPLTQVLEQGFRSINSVEKTYRTKQGKLIPVLFSASVMRGLHGEIQGVVCLARDITDLKKTEEKLKKSARVNKEMYDELRTFSYVASHDLRTPLVNIRGFSDELLRGTREIGPVVAQYLEHAEDGQRQRFRQIMEQDIPDALKFIDSSVNRMNTLINAILTLSQVDCRRKNPVLIRTEEMVQGILTTMARQIESRRTTLIAGKLPDLIADRAAVEQVFGNLLDNAVKYLDPDRPGEISITGEPGNEEMIFHIRDNGRGMSREDIPRAFEIFRRVGTQDVPGAGMGLAYVKTSIRMLGGRIWCESEPGQGTTFSFALPLQPEEFGERVPTRGQG